MRSSGTWAGAFMLGMFVCSAAALAQQDGNEWRDPYLTGDAALYPQPRAVETVPRAAEVKRNPSMASVPANAESLAAGDNGSVRIELLRVVRGDEIAGVPAPAGMEAIILVTRWTNIHPRELIEKSKLEGKADRTYGAGGLFSGGGGGAGDKEMVELDVAYKVPKAGQHVFLATAGLAWDLNAGNASLPNGVAPGAEILIARFGESREIRFAYLAPAGAKDIALRFFDYSNGHISLPVAGDRQAALTGGGPAAALDRGNIGGLEIAVTGIEYAAEYLGVAAPEGWRFARVELFGRSDAKQGDMGAIATIDPTKYVWLAGDGGYVWYGLPPAEGGRLVSFTPELFQRREMVFLAPADAERFQLGLRGRNEVRILKATAETPAPMPPAAASYADGETLDLALLGLRWEGDSLVADLAVTPKTGAKGVELNLAQQFLIADAGGAEVSADLAATKRLTRRPPEPAVVPPGTPMRFELAFAAPAGFTPATLRYRGFAGAGVLDLSAVPVAGDRGAATPGGTTDFPEIKAPDAAAPVVAAATQTSEPAVAVTPSVAVKARLGPPDEPPQLMPVALPEFDPATAVKEVEPNDKREQATPLGPGYAATGATTGKDYDWYLLRVEGEPQLWSFEASGPGVRNLGIYRAGGKSLVERYVTRGQTSVRIDNVLLLPGPYWLELRPSDEGGAYSVRAAPLGRPDRYAEFEPNDKADNAHVLRFGQPRRGLIGHKDDKDLYRFSLSRPTHLVLSVIPPPGKLLYLSLETGRWRVTANRRAKPGEPVRYQALLGVGDYQLTLQAEGDWRSDTPYEVRLDRLDPFEMPADLEPNDVEYQARPLGGRRQFTGAVGAFRDHDWYRLPSVTRETALTVTLESDSGVSPTLYFRDGDRAKTGQLREDREQSSGDSRVYRGVLKPDRDGLLSIRGQGDYRITLAYDPPVAEGEEHPGEAAIGLVLSGQAPVFNAYRNDLQEAPVSLSVSNNGEVPQRILLDSEAGESGWDLALEVDELNLAPGESRTVSATLRAMPDRPAGRPAPIFLRAQNTAGAGATAVLAAEAACDAPPVAPRRYESLPESLRGGLNLAWTALGAEAVADSDSARRKFAPLFDGMTPLKASYNISGDKMPFDVTVRLAAAADIAGVVLFPRAAGKDQSNLGPFEILASTDGKAFSPVFAGYLERSEIEQAFVFDSPVRASHVRLRLTRADRLNRSGQASLGEWNVVAAPGSRPFADRRLNIANPALGGHVVWTSWKDGYNRHVAMLTEEKDARKIKIAPLQPIEWVIGFHHERAARIARIAWRDIAKASDRDRRFDSIKVSVSTGGPTGPWRPVADWTLERDDTGNAELVPQEPVWARFVRFSAPGSDKKADWLIPETLGVFEQPEGDGYLSVLGEWGRYARDAAFERSAGTDDSVVLEDRGGPGPEAATLLAIDDVLGGRVQVGADEDWFRVDAPDGMARLEFAFDGAGAERLIPALQDSAGKTVELVEGDEIEGARVFHAEVTPGESYLLRVREARRSIMIAWDNSGSVGAYHATMYRAITRFVDDIRPGLEVVNLLPFRSGGALPLLENWTDDPLALKQALGAYDRKDSSSDSEKTLVGAMRKLAERQGNRGIVFLTDANSSGDALSAGMWQMFHEVRPRVFALELQLAEKKVAHFQDLMQDWAAVNNGHYSVFRNQADLDVAFDRAACLLRRPAEYRVALRRGPGPGNLRVLWQEGKAMAGATIELILDASGSMRSRKNKVGGKLKIDVAKDVMREIIGLLPDDSQVGLRVYGHRKKEGTKGDCQDSKLVVRIGDLNRDKLLAAVKKIKALGTTPIAYSLQQAGKDLKGVKGPKLIVLITDGKEECKADPAAAVKELREQGIDVRVDIVGFALAEEKVKEDMLRAAEAGGGRFFDAQDRDALAAAIRKTLAMPFEVLDSRGRQAAAGLTDQDAMNLYQGDYSVIVRTAKGDVTVRDVRVVEGRATEVVLAREEDGIRVQVSDPGAPE